MFLFWPYVSQNGSAGDNSLWAATALADGSVVLAGYTTGSWSGSNQGAADFAVVKLDVDGLEEWRWQVMHARDLILLGFVVHICGNGLCFWQRKGLGGQAIGGIVQPGVQAC